MNQVTCPGVRGLARAAQRVIAGAVWLGGVSVGAVSVGGLNFLLAGSVLAADAVVHTHDGRLVMGRFLSETPERVTIEIEGVPAVFWRDEVAEVQVVLSEAEVLAESRKAIADDDLPARVDLAARMIEAKAYGLAAQEIQSLKADFPDEPFADSLSQLMLTAQAGDALASAQAPGPATAAERVREQRAGVLTDEQVVIVKLGERQRPDPDPSIRLVIPPTVITALFERHPGRAFVPGTRDAQAAFREQSPWEQLMVFEAVGDDTLTGSIRVIGDPTPLRTFRQTINPRYIWSYFGRHFNGVVDGMDLTMGRPNAVPMAYTNFVRLSRLEVDGQRVINRLEPEKSLLLQWGLPRDVAEFPAPEVERWQPYFKSRQDPQYLALLGWIDGLITSPDYLQKLPATLDGGSQEEAREGGVQIPRRR